MYIGWFQQLLKFPGNVTTIENNMEVPQNIKNRIALHLAILLLGIYFQNTNSKEYKHSHVHCSIIYNSQDMEATQVPIIDKCIKKWQLPAKMEA